MNLQRAMEYGSKDDIFIFIEITYIITTTYFHWYPQWIKVSLNVFIWFAANDVIPCSSLFKSQSFLLQSNFLHHLTDFLLYGTVLWMIWWPRYDRKIARTDTVQNHVVYVPAVMCDKVIPDKNLMEISDGDIVCLNILADVVAEVVKDICHGSNVVYTLDPTLRALDTPLSMRSQAWISWLNHKDDGYLCPVEVVPVFFDTQHLHGPSPHAVTLF